MITQKSLLAMSRVLLAITIAVTFFLATTPLQIPVVESIHDKIKHASAFFILALLMDYSFPGRDFRFKVLALTAYGLVIEIIQSYLPYRSCSLFDLAANTVGMVFYGFLLPWLTRAPILKERQ